VSEQPEVIRAGRRTVEISRPQKPLFPCGITKSDLAHYYEQVAEPMLRQITDRPLNLERYPDGSKVIGSSSSTRAPISPTGSAG
jgi:bifunctional non-homologous end joining protein LigD